MHMRKERLVMLQLLKEFWLMQNLISLRRPVQNTIIRDVNGCKMRGTNKCLLSNEDDEVCARASFAPKDVETSFPSTIPPTHTHRHTPLHTPLPYQPQAASSSACCFLCFFVRCERITTLLSRDWYPFLPHVVVLV